ncbi:prostate stem cell antigen isoform X3 [Cavia porcellus]|uniref:prostate stem cell antigen isoform X3 n=1 Tax=Cavia porcellus TaxID=10141 RepID=UPI002FE0FBEF
MVLSGVLSLKPGSQESSPAFTQSTEAPRSPQFSAKSLDGPQESGLPGPASVCEAGSVIRGLRTCQSSPCRASAPPKRCCSAVLLLHCPGEQPRLPEGTELQPHGHLLLDFTCRS